MGMAGLSAPTSGTTALSGGALSSPMGMISPGAANSGTSLFGGASGGAGLTDPSERCARLIYGPDLRPDFPPAPCAAVEGDAIHHDTRLWHHHAFVPPAKEASR